MRTSFEQTLTDAVALLRQLPRDRKLAEDVRARFQRFRAAHRGVRCDLLVDQPPGSNQADYDILLGAPDGGTVAVSWRRDDGVPWTVQYADHWAANYVLSVGDLHTSIQSALIYLNVVLNRQPNLMKDLVDKSLVQQAIRESPPRVSDKEIQRAVDSFRASHGLHRASDTRRWLEEMNLTTEALRELAAYNVRAANLKKRVTARRLRPYFEAHRQDLDVLTVFRVQASSRAAAAKLAQNAKRGGLWAALQKRGSPASTVKGQLATLHACELPSPFAGLSAHAIAGPYRSDGEYWVGQVLQKKAARFDAVTRAKIEDLLFDDWLAEQRKRASLRWHWI